MKAEGVALVTGAGRGIGRGVALELARRGFDVVATMRDPSSTAGDSLRNEWDAKQTAGDAAAVGSLRVEALDVTVPSSISVPTGLRVLVNNAGVDDENHPFEETELDVWRRVFETNVFGVVEVTKRAVPVLRAAGGGVVCNVTSAGLLAPMPFFSVYRASKAAVAAIGETLRAELAPHHIRLLEILPGPIATDMLAASATVPEAISSSAYRPLAEVVAAARGDIDAMATPVVDAARAIVDAILDDDSPLRVSCDPLGIALLDDWRAKTDEVNAAGYLRAFRVLD